MCEQSFHPYEETGIVHPENNGKVRKGFSIDFNIIYRKFEIEFSAACFYFLWMIEPLDLAHHAARAGLPQHLNLANVWTVRATRGQEDSTVIDVQGVLAPLDALEEEFLALALAARSLVSLASPGPQLSSFVAGQVRVGCTAMTGALQHGIEFV